MKIVLDTNVFISAIIFGGPPETIIRLGIDKEVEIFTSPSILAEVADVLSRKFKWDTDKIDLTIRNLCHFCNIIEPKKKVNMVDLDPSDNKILECAIESKAKFLVTGDKKHLIPIKNIEKCKILTPGDFISLY